MMKQIFWQKFNPGGISRRLTDLPLAAEITILLMVKVALITALAKTFFAHPEAKHMQMPVQSVEQRMLAPASFSASSNDMQHSSEKITKSE
ncbi:cytochrome oxidase putative small subunit CydP [Herbaspirillum sp. C7C8]|uniref:cytochrome oxidase putative small subunit CydP n=1 Tax=Herbaspirillum sp. C7C8 TaxID=2736665 RepID=UPI001F51B402|nr:cytochrome oxidase putative small subunit CydP [Herbaspirillum sp. C7C8]